MKRQTTEAITHILSTSVMSLLPRREFIKVTGALGAGLAAGPLVRAAGTSSPSPRPNILVFLTDDHGQWAQHCYGNSELITPNLDRLARQGTRMTQAFTTCPVCSPARASFFTGRMPSQHGVHDFLGGGKAAQMDWLAGQPLISELLKDAGYRTGLVGKWHCGREREPQRGFDRWFSYWVNQYPHEGEQHFSDQGQRVVEEGQQSPLLTRRVLDFLRTHRETEGDHGRPFFLFVGYVDTHSPHKQAPADLVKQYQSATFRDIHQEPFAPCHGKPLEPVNPDPDIERTRHMEYYGAVSSIDREIGKVLAALAENGQLENTLIVYTGDHGLNCGQHGMWEKGFHTTPQNFLEESVRVACTVSWPAGGIRQNATCDDFVNHCDLWATLLDIAGATPSAAVAAQINSPGITYLPQLRGQAIPNWRKTIISEYGNARMARNERFKLIRRRPFGGVGFPDELYDLQTDPRETVNCYDQPAHQDTIRDLSVALDRYFSNYTVSGHSGWELENQSECNSGTPWIRAAKEHQG